MNNRKPKASSRMILALGFLLIGGGTAGFMLLRGENAFDALYQTLVILIAHFYHVVEGPVSFRILVLGLMLGGLVLVAYLIKWFVEYIIEGELKGGFAQRRMDRRIAALADHYIVSGLGRVGRQIAEELAEEGVPFVVTDRDPARLEYAKERGWLMVLGSATSDAVLEHAGIKKARGLVVATGNDADNVFITLGARAPTSRTL